MGNSGTDISQQVKVFASCPMQPRMMVKENAVTNNRMIAETTNLIKPADRCFSVPGSHLMKLIYALCRVNLEGKVSALRMIVSLFDQHRTAGIHLRWADHAGEAARRMLMR